MRSRNISKLKYIYIAFVAILVVLCFASVLYVRGLLVKYEASQPEKQVAAAVELLLEETEKKDSFWKKYELPKLDEKLQKKYVKLFSQDDLSFVSKSASSKDELIYEVKANGMTIAEVTLKAKGPAVTKLAVFSMRDWDIKSYKPMIEKRSYNVLLPEGFTVTADGVKLVSESKKPDANGKFKYTVADAYLIPEFVITDTENKKIGYTVQGSRVLPDIFEYNLTLPTTVKVIVNGEESKGKLLTDGRLKHGILTTEKPEIKVIDIYGNKVDYDGSALPLTYCKIAVAKGYTVKLEGKNLPSEAISKSLPKKYELLEGLVENLPTQTVYEVAILKENAKISVKDSNGKAVKLKEGQTEYDFTEQLASSDTVPEEIAAKVDVLKVAQNWSLFMSNDCSFSKISGYLLPNSYQYKVAKDYANSVDRQFFSSHTLENPAFTDNKVANFTKITDDCFTVEISFVKHMRLDRGRSVDDAMNDRFYFVYKDNKWLLAGLKEVEADAK